MHPTEPSFISLYTHSLANMEINRKFKNKLAWFSPVLLVGKEKWSLEQRDIQEKKQEKLCLLKWSSSSLLTMKVTTIRERATATKDCWDLRKSWDFSHAKLYVVLSRLSLLFWLALCSLPPFSPHATLPTQPLLLLRYTQLEKSRSFPMTQLLPLPHLKTNLTLISSI